MTCAYEDGQLTGIDTVVVSTQHTSAVELDEIRATLIEYLIKPRLPDHLLSDDTIYHYESNGAVHCGGSRVIADLLGGRSSWIRTVVKVVMEELSPVKTPPRWTEVQLTWLATSQKMGGKRAWPMSAKSSLHMPLESLTRQRSRR